MRLFIGVELEERVKAAAAEAAARLRGRLQTASPGLIARWIPEDSFHITLVFVGEVPDERAQAIGVALEASPLPIASFDLVLSGCGAFPPTGAPRVLWIGARDGAAEMLRLHDQIEARLLPLGVPGEGRAYTAHLTVARIKEAGGGSARQLHDIVSATPADCGRSRISAVVLFRSRLSPRGASYEPLLRVPLL